jgi:hypothetical protein
MATTKPTPAPANHATREWTWRARALTRQLDRAGLLLQQQPGDASLVEIRAILAAAVKRCERGEVGSGEADAIAALAQQALNATEALARAGGR